jgi:membrane-bound lytic murein transglycosylase F
MKVLLSLLSTLLLTTCSQPPGLLEQVLAKGELRVVTRNSPDAYYLGSQGPEGPGYDLASRFAEHLGVPMRLYTVRTREEAIEEVAAGRAHIAAAGLSTGVSLPHAAQFGPGYQRVREHLVHRRRTTRPRTIVEAARGEIHVATGSAHQRTLEDLRLNHPELAWVERAGTDTEEILADVSQGRVQYTLASSTEFALNRSVHPELAIALDLSPERALAWVVSTAGHDDSLLNRVNSYFVLARREGVIAALLERYYGEDDRFDYLLSRRFMEHLNSRLPRYLAWFQEAATTHGLDWRLLAAMGYQESKWDPDAVSFTGVRGIMQLTEDTAARMRAGDRRDPRSSIFGGAKYLATLQKTIPPRIPDPDRTWFAVAAYNVGIGHLEDGRVLAQSQGRNPDRWEDVREFLPLLSQERWYTRTKRGYARGWEPVRYVDNVQAYLNILQVAGTTDAVPAVPPEPGVAAPRKRR